MSGFDVGTATRIWKPRCANILASILLLSLPGWKNVAAQASPPFQIVAPWQTVLIEHEDRMRRLKALASVQYAQHPDYFEYSIRQAQHKLPAYPTAVPVLRVVFRDQVFFDSDKTELKQGADPILNTIASSLRLEPPDVTVFVAGHADSLGSANYNLGLGLRRARAVAIALAAIGVKQAQIYLVSFGKSVPIASNENSEGRARNRRVEFLFSARPEPIAAWLATQATLTCTPDASRKGDNCPADFRFRAESVSIAPSPASIPMSSRAKTITIKPKASSKDIGDTSKAKSVVLGNKVYEIDLREKVFEMRPPE